MAQCAFRVQVSECPRRLGSQRGREGARGANAALRWALRVFFGAVDSDSFSPCNGRNTTCGAGRISRPHMSNRGQQAHLPQQRPQGILSLVGLGLPAWTCQLILASPT